MKKNIVRGGLFALALSVGLSAVPAPAQELNSMYITPKIIHSKKTGDMSNASWTDPDGFSRGVLGGEDKDKGFGFGLALGNDFSYSTPYPVRLEAEYIYHGEGEYNKGPSVIFRNGKTQIASQKFKIKAHSLMVNAFYDINLDSALTPYVGGGVGLAYMKTSYTSSAQVTGVSDDRVSGSNNDWGFAWNIGGGVSYALDNQMALDFGYRYFDLGEADSGTINNHSTGYRGSSKVDLSAHEFSVGLRFSGF